MEEGGENVEDAMAELFATTEAAIAGSEGHEVMATLVKRRCRYCRARGSFGEGQTFSVCMQCNGFKYVYAIDSKL